MTTKQCKSMQLKRFSSFSKGVIMRINLTIAILTLCCVQLSAEVFGQRVTLKVHNAPFLEAIRSIEKQSGYTFFYKMKDIDRSEEHTSELQSLMRISYAVFCLKKKKKHNKYTQTIQTRI